MEKRSNNQRADEITAWHLSDHSLQEKQPMI